MKKKKFVSGTMPSKNCTKPFLNSETFSIPSYMKNEGTNSKASENLINSSDKGSSCSSPNPSCSLIQTNTYGVNLDGLAVDENKTGENIYEGRGSQMEPYSFAKINCIFVYVLGSYFHIFCR